MSRRKRTKRNSPSLVAGGGRHVLTRIGNALIGLVMTPVLARYLGPASFGRYVVVMTVVAFVTLLADGGLPLYAQRELAGARGEDDGVRRQLWRSRTFLTAAVTLGAVVVAVVLSPDHLRLPVVIGILGLPPLSAIGFLIAELTADLRPAAVARVELSHRLLTLAGVTVAVLSGGDLLTVLTWLVLGQYAAALVGIALIRPRPPRMKAKSSGPTLRLIFRRALPLSLIPLLTIVYSRTDVMVLAIFRGDAEVGVYGVMYRGIEVMLGLLTVASSLLLTIATRSSVEARPRVRSQGVGLSVGAAIIMVSGGMALSAPLLVALGGRSFLIPIATVVGELSPAVGFSLLLAAFALMAMGTVNASLMIAWGLERQLFRHVLLIVAVNVGLTFLFVPQAGLVGAAAATLVSEIVAAWNSTRLLNRAVERAPRIGLMVRAVLVAGLILVAGTVAVDAPVIARFCVVALAGLFAVQFTGWRRVAARAIRDLDAHSASVAPSPLI